MLSKLNIMLLVMESIRVDCMGCYGGPVANTPNLERLAERGVVFRNAISAGAWTVSSIASMFTGLYPSSHRLIAGSKQRLPEKVRTLPELLQAAGYRTTAIFSTDYLTDVPDFFRGFGERIKAQDLPASFVELLRHPGVLFADRDYVRSLAWNIVNGRDARTYYMTLVLKRWLEQFSSDEPFFCFVHFQMPHAPYNPPRPFHPDLNEYGFDRTEQKRLADRTVGWQYMAGAVDLNPSVFEYYKRLYAAEIAYLDWRIGQILDTLEKRGLLENTLVIAIGDHGENIGDHGLMFHNFSVYETITHIPWIMAVPDGYQFLAEVDTPVSQTDLLPTVLGLLGEERRIPSEVQGLNLLPLLTNNGSSEKQDRCVFTELERPQSVLQCLRKARSDVDVSGFDKAMKAARTRRWKYIVESDGLEYLYDVLSDPFESQNIVDRRPDILAELRSEIEKSLGEFALQDTTLI